MTDESRIDEGANHRAFEREVEAGRHRRADPEAGLNSERPEGPTMPTPAEDLMRTIRPKPNIHVISRKVTERHCQTGFASSGTLIDDFVFRFGDTKSPLIQDRFQVRAAIFLVSFRPSSAAKSRLLLCGWCLKCWVRATKSA
jgi:hypothetical protein